MTILLTQTEVAERLRCSVAKVQAIRRKGLLAFIPSRPVMITEDDLEAYLARIKIQAKPTVLRSALSEEEAMEAKIHRQVRELGRQMRRKRL